MTDYQRNFSNVAVMRHTVGEMDASTTVLTLDGPATGWPPVPFSLVVDPDVGSEETLLCTAITQSSNPTLTVIRGWDESTPLKHSSGAVVRHAGLAADFQNISDLAFYMKKGTFSWGDIAGKGMTFRGVSDAP